METDRAGGHSRTRSRKFPPETNPFKQALDYALRLLARRSRSRSELAQRLAQKGFSEALSARVFTDLDAWGYLDDPLFARQWAGDKWKLRGWGPRRLRAGLYEKGIDRDLIDEVLGELVSENNEREQAGELLARRFKNFAPDSLQDPKIKQRFFSFLYRLGYSTEAIGSALNRFSRQDSSPDF